MALILAVFIVALLTVVLTEFLYRSRVDSDAAVNAEDMQQARYAARAGVEAARFFFYAKPAEWADAMMSLGVPGFGAGGFLLDLEKASAVDAAQKRLQGEVFTGDTNLTGADALARAYDIERDDPDGFDNGYLLFDSLRSGIDLFAVSQAPERGLGAIEPEAPEEDVNVQIRFVDESGKLNLNALYYCKPGFCGGDPNSFNRVLFFEIRQLFINELLLRPRYDEETPDKRGSEDLSEEDAAASREHFFNERGKELQVQDVSDILCAVLDWLDPDDNPASTEGCDEGAENEHYALLDEPYETRNGPFESVGELRLVRGVTQDIYRKVAPYLTVYPRTKEGSCTERLKSLSQDVPEGKELPCYDDKVNLHAASDAVLWAWATGGFNPADRQEPDPARESKEFRDEVLNALNCARLPEGKKEEHDCPPPPAGTQTAGAKTDCWKSGADLESALSGIGTYAIQEVAKTPNLGTEASQNGIKCTESGGSPSKIDQAAQQSFRQMTSDFITVEAIGQMGAMEAENQAALLEEEGKEEQADLLPKPIEYKITATYRIDPTKQGEEIITLLRWQEQ